MPVTRTERGWAGHFCCSDRCQFHRNTLLECGEERIVVSTVGAYRPPMAVVSTVGAYRSPMAEDNKFDSIGYNRWYETMAFHAENKAGCWEADVSRDAGFKSPWSINVPPDMPYTDMQADAMHEAVVAELTARLEGGA